MTPYRFAGYDRPRDLANDALIPLTKRLDALKAWRAAIARERARAGPIDDLERLDRKLDDAIGRVLKELRDGD